MNAQHTPGPWEISEHTRPKGRPISICKFNGPAFTELAYVPSHGAYSEANARLIAAAPELLEALQMVCDSGVHLAKPIEEAMLAALAKVKP